MERRPRRVHAASGWIVPAVHYCRSERGGRLGARASHALLRSFISKLHNHQTNPKVSPIPSCNRLGATENRTMQKSKEFFFS